MKAERIRELKSRSARATTLLSDARGAFAQRPQVRPASAQAPWLLKSQARHLIKARNNAETVLADIGDAGGELDTELQQARTEYADAQERVAAAEQGEQEGGLASVGGQTSAGKNARARAQRASAVMQNLQQQGDRLEQAREPLQTAVNEATSGPALLAGFEGPDRDAAATALENAEKAIGRPRRQAPQKSVLRALAAGGGVGLGLGAAIGAGLGAIAGVFLGSAGIGAAIGAGAGALIGGLFGSVGSAMVATRRGRRTVPGSGTRDLRSEAEFDNVDARRDPALAPERLAALNASAPAPESGEGNGILDHSDEPSAAARQASSAVVAASTRNSSARTGQTSIQAPALPSISEDDLEKVEPAADMRDLADPFGAVSAASTLPSIADDATGEEEAEAEDQRQAVAGTAHEESAGPQMSEEERAIMEEGLRLKESGAATEAESRVPADAKAMFGTRDITAVQQHEVDKTRLRNQGSPELAALAAGPPGAREAARGRETESTTSSGMLNRLWNWLSDDD